MQYADEVPHTAAETVSFFEPGAKQSKRFGKLPVTQNSRMIQGTRSMAECDQIVPGVENFLIFPIAAGMSCHNRVLMDNLHSIDEAFDRDRLECHVPRYAVSDIVEPDHLVLINHRGLTHTRLERMPRQRCRLLNIELQHITDGERRRHRAFVRCSCR